MRRSQTLHSLWSVGASALLAASLLIVPGTALAAVDPQPSVAVEPGEPFEVEGAPVESDPVESESSGPAAEAGEGDSAPSASSGSGLGEVSYRGSLLAVPDADDAESVLMLRVGALGLLAVDVSAIEGRVLLGAATVTLAAPAGLSLTGDIDADFALLNAYQAEHGAFAATEVVSEVDRGAVGGDREVAARGNTTAFTSGTHYITAVLSSPSNGPASTDQSAATIQAAVDYADQYWSKQTGGKVRFKLQSVVGFQQSSSYNCSTATSSATTSFWNAEAARAGFTWQVNTHLVIVFPSTTDCDGTLGLGSVGWSANEGGHLWSIGAGSNDGKATIAHELGHNLTLGHSDWLDCDSASPSFPLSTTSVPSGCTAREYGDVVDVMGYGQSGKLSGALSAAHAIRAGFWTEGKEFSVAKQGTTTHSLKTLSGYSGKRAILASDTTGTDFYIEYRDNSGDDAVFTQGIGSSGGTDLAIMDGAGVRIQVLENATGSYGYYFKGWAGDNTRLIGRTVTGNKTVTLVAGQSYTNNGLTIAVTKISGGTATVKVTRAKSSVGLNSNVYWLSPTMQQIPENFVAGDVISVMFPETTRADSYSISWYRGSPYWSDWYEEDYCISGKKIASGQHYRTTTSDVDKCLYAKVTAKIAGQSSKSFTTGFAWGPDYKAYFDGTEPIAAIDATGSSLRAYVTGVNATKYASVKYQWYRNGAAISKATKSTYTPTSSDRDKSLSVKVTYTATDWWTNLDKGDVLTDTSDAAKYSIDSSGTLAIQGSEPRRVGQTLTLNALSYTQGVGGAALTPTRSYQWYRDGAAIKGATGAGYTLTSADYGKRISAKVTAKQGALLAHSATTAKTGKVALGTIAGSLAAPTVDKAASPSRLLTAALAPGSVTESGVKVSWQWLRDGKPISKATKSTYTPTSSDYGRSITVQATLTKSRYSTVKLVSDSRAPELDSVLRTSPANQSITGHLAIGVPLTAPVHSYSPSPDAVQYQWYRDGKAIKSATSSVYTPTSADNGKRLAVKTTFTKAGFLGASVTSPSTPRVGVAQLPGALELQHQAEELLLVGEETGSGKLVLTAPADGVTDADAKRSWQWYRDGKAIAKATKSSYTPTSSDKGKALHVRISVTRSGFSETVRTSHSRDFSVKAAKPTITGTAKVGQALTTPSVLGQVQANSAVGDWSTSGVSATVQWLRDGKTITGATSTAYVPIAADRGRKLSVRVTQSHGAGRLSSVQTSSSVTIGAGTITAGAVAVTASGSTYTVAPGAWATVGAPVTVALKYQWYYNGKAVSKATGTSYTLKSGQLASKLRVKVTGSAGGYASVAVTRAAV